MSHTYVVYNSSLLSLVMHSNINLRHILEIDSRSKKTTNCSSEVGDKNLFTRNTELKNLGIETNELPVILWATRGLL